MKVADRPALMRRGKYAASGGVDSPSGARIRLLHVTTVPMSLIFLRGQVGFMREHGFDVFAACSPGPEIAAFTAAEGVPVTEIEMPRRVTPMRDILALIRLCLTIRRFRPDIVHAHTPKGGLLGMLAAVVMRVPVRIYHMRGLPFVTARGPKRWLLLATEFLTSRLAHAVLCVGPSVMRTAVSTGLCRPERACILENGSGNGVDARGRFDPSQLPARTREAVRTRLGIPLDATVIGFVGRIVREKGIVELSGAWKSLRAQPRLHLLLVGPVEPQDPVPEDVLAALRNDDRVRFAGYDLDTPALYAAMDLLALPSHREGFPNVPLEAAAMGLPVVATRVPGCVDAVLDGVTGTFVKPLDADDLAGALDAYVANPFLASAHGSAGRLWVTESFQPESIWQALAAFYRQRMPAQLHSRRVHFLHKNELV